MTGTDAGNTTPDAALLPPAAPASDRPRGRGLPGFFAFLLVWALAGGFVGALAARLDVDPFAAIAERAPAVSAPLVLLFAVLTVWPNIVVHEAGHALCGIARGMHAVALGVGPLRWERGGSRWHFRYGDWIRGLGGFAALVPRGRRGLSGFDQACFLAGGPLANLLTAVLALAVLAPWTPSPLAAAFLLGTAASALFLGVVNLLPFRAHGWHSDGRQLLDLVRRSPDAAIQQRVRQLLALTQAGVRPRDWPDALVPGPVEGASPALAVNADLLRLGWAMDRGDAATGFESASRAIAGFHALPIAARPHLAAAIAGYAAVMLRDPVVLAAWRTLCEGGVIDLSVIRDWLDAELAELSGDAATARDRAAAVRARLDRLPDPVSSLQLREHLDALEARLDAR